MNAGENLKILFGMPEKTARGGINACEPPFLRALARIAGVAVEETVTAYDHAGGVSAARRVRQVAATARRLRGRLAAGAFDLAHLNTAFDKKAVLRDAFTLSVIGRGPKIFLKFHGSDLDFLAGANAFYRALIGRVVARADRIGVLSNEERAAFVAAGLPAEKFAVVKNALTSFPQEGFPPVENSFAEGSFRLVFASRLIPTKGLLETVRALAILREAGRPATLDVLGDGPARAAAESLAAELGLDGAAVRFRGHVAEEIVQGFYRAADCLVFPTFHAEGFPMVVFNALRWGLPVVTTRARAAADYLKEGENCLFCEAKSPASVAARVAALIDDAGLRARMRTNNRALAERFAADRVAPEYLALYREILGRGGG